MVVNIVYSSSDSYMKCTGVSILSLYENNKNIQYLNVFVITSNVTDDTGTSTGDSTTGTGETGDATTGSGTGGDSTGSTGTGTGGSTGGSSSGSNPAGSTTGTGPTFGTAPEGPGGPGDGFGDGLGGGDEGGMMSGGGHDPEWGELFAYTSVDGYKAKQLAPYKDAIIKARGMLA